MSPKNEKVNKEQPAREDEDQTSQDELPEVELSEEELRQACHEQICPGCELLEEQKQNVLRTLAETENFKKRVIREKEEFCKYAVTSFVEEIIPVMDNLELALEHGRKNEACKDLVQGVEMTLSLFSRVLEKNNLIQVGTVGEEFDPGFHEAVAQEERDDLEQGTVCQVLQKGYVLNDRLVRPAKVMVSKKREK
ncbi:MAG: nucleotide exchange factor GrpE [Desulfonatronovibrio sp.]